MFEDKDHLCSTENNIPCADIQWSEDGIPWSPLFRDLYFSIESLHSISGLPSQSEFVFIRGNELPRRFGCQSEFCIGELGFGAGLNFLSTCALWHEFKQQHTGGPSGILHYLAFEQYPLSREDLQKVHALWPALIPYSEILVRRYPALKRGFHEINLPEFSVQLSVAFGPAIEMLPQVHLDGGKWLGFDAWYLDGFSPSQNPDMWSEEICQHLGRLSSSGSTFSTYTAASSVRQAMSNSGFRVEKCKGLGRKRHMLRGYKEPRNDP